MQLADHVPPEYVTLACPTPAGAMLAAGSGAGSSWLPGRGTGRTDGSRGPIPAAAAARSAEPRRLARIGRPARPAPPATERRVPAVQGSQPDPFGTTELRRTVLDAWAA